MAHRAPILMVLILIVSLAGLTSRSFIPLASAHLDSDDRRVTPVPSMQNEPSLAVNPANPNNMVLGYNDYSTGTWRPHYAYSIDGGNTWSVGVSPLSTSGQLTASLCCDSAVAFDRMGGAYYLTITAIILGRELVLYYSPPDIFGNAGASWSAPMVLSSLIGSSYGIDKPSIAIDTTGGPFDGHIYLAWVDYFQDDFLLNAERIMMRTGIVGPNGPTFSTPAIQASDPSNRYNHGPALAVGTDGRVYLAHVRHFSQITDADSVRISRSDDGGASFALKGQMVQTIVPPPYTIRNTGGNARANPFPTIAVFADGTVAVMWTDYRNLSDMDIMSAISPDRGATWGNAFLVNNDKTDPLTSNGVDQFMPAAATIGNILYVFFYDRRNDPADTRTFLYAARSATEGHSYSQEFPISDVFTDPSVCSFNVVCLFGDYIAAAASRGSPTSPNVFNIAWADGRDGTVRSNDINVYFERFSDCTFCVSTSGWRGRVNINSLIVENPCRLAPCLSNATATILSVGGFNGTVKLSMTGLPAGVSATFTPTAGMPPFTSKITINSTLPVHPFDGNVTVVGSSSDGNQSMTTIHLTLTNQPFLETGLVGDGGGQGSTFSVGDDLRLTGHGFAANVQVRIFLDGNLLASPQTDQVGSFSASSKIPVRVAPGQHKLGATDALGNSATLTILTPRGEADFQVGDPDLVRAFVLDWADSDNDGKVTILDIASAALAFGKPDAYWDFNRIGKVDIVDIAQIAFYFDRSLDPAYPGQGYASRIIDPAWALYCSSLPTPYQNYCRARSLLPNLVFPTCSQPGYYDSVGCVRINDPTPGQMTFHVKNSGQVPTSFSGNAFGLFRVKATCNLPPITTCSDSPTYSAAPVLYPVGDPDLSHPSESIQTIQMPFTGREGTVCLVLDDGLNVDESNENDNVHCFNIIL